MRKPTFAESLARATASRNTWVFAGITWLFALLALAVLILLGIAAGVRLGAAARYFVRLALLAAVVTSLVAVAGRAYDERRGAADQWSECRPAHMRTGRGHGMR